MKQIDQLIDWNSIEKAIAIHYSPLSDSAASPLTRDCRCLRYYWSGFETVV
ncbi:MAG: hypothetical protein LM517_03010 [Nitrosomonas sp.]|nr:hypothetical protein [Nitrosomonas sp.]